MKLICENYSFGVLEIALASAPLSVRLHFYRSMGGCVFFFHDPSILLGILLLRKLFENMELHVFIEKENLSRL